MFQKIQIAKIFSIAILLVSSLSLAMNGKSKPATYAAYFSFTKKWDANHLAELKRLGNEPEYNNNTDFTPILEAEIANGKTFRSKNIFSAIGFGSVLGLVSFWTYKNPAEATLINYTFGYLPILCYIPGLAVFTKSIANVFEAQNKLKNMYSFRNEIKKPSLNNLD